MAEGATVAEVCRELEVSEATYHRWNRRYGAMSQDQLKRLKALEKENARLKKIVADQAVDLSILKEAAEGNF
jgi:transposase-like protein